MRNQIPGNRGNRAPRNRGSNNDRRPYVADQDRTNRFNRGDQQTERPFRKRMIKRDQAGKVKGGPKDRRDKKKNDDRDLDRELRDYWIGQKGNKADGEVKELARQKLDSEMDSYWKTRKEEAEAKKAE